MVSTALAVVTDYIHRIWNRQEVQLIPQICADPIVRHDAENVTRLTHEAQIKRIQAFGDRGFVFSDVILAGDETYITSVWNLEGDGGAFRKSGIEVFKVLVGRITDVWNSTYVDGLWG